MTDDLTKSIKEYYKQKEGTSHEKNGTSNLLPAVLIISIIVWSIISAAIILKQYKVNDMKYQNDTRLPELINSNEEVTGLYDPINYGNLPADNVYTVRQKLTNGDEEICHEYQVIPRPTIDPETGEEILYYEYLQK